jgi:beta-N-acetylglucosaminidase
MSTYKQLKLSEDVTQRKSNVSKVGGNMVADRNMSQTHQKGRSNNTPPSIQAKMDFVGSMTSGINDVMGQIGAAAGATVKALGIKGTMYVDAEGLNLREKPSASKDSTILAVASKQEAVIVLEYGDGWHKVNYKGKVGYMSAKYLTETNMQSPQTNEAQDAGGQPKKETSPIDNVTDLLTGVAEKIAGIKGFMYVDATGLNLREKPSASKDSTILAVASHQEIVMVLEYGDVWNKVNYKGKVGYMSTKYLTKTKEQNAGSSNATSSPTSNANSGSNSQAGAPPKTETAVTEGQTSTSNYSGTLKEALDAQMNAKPQIQKNGKWVDATDAETLKHLDPKNLMEGANKFQFLDLSASAGISEEDMAKYLEGKGILAGKASSYLRAAKQHNINEIYLAAHSALETGNGTSQLAKGVKVKDATVYNMYGIGAIDKNPVGGGSQTAYDQGWTTPEKAIEDGARWVGEKYIHNEKYQQNTLYEMRWNPNAPASHQYATDVNWASAQAKTMKNLYDTYFPDANLKFDMPQYQGEPLMTQPPTNAAAEAVTKPENTTANSSPAATTVGVRDTTALHPRLQAQITALKAACEKESLKISITECFRSVKYQDDLYAKGRTTEGKIVTNAQGSSYSSQHQWGVAFDFCRNDGQNAYKDDDGFFTKVGKVGKSIGLGWGGDWTSPVDKPHFYLTDWGDTTTKLKTEFGTPDKFIATW